MRDEPFFDTNILIYAFLKNDHRNAVARDLVTAGGAISVQVLNEFVAVGRRKAAQSWEQIFEALTAIRYLCPTIVPLSSDTHDAGLRVATRYGFHIFDSMIIAAALEARCDTLYSEDMHNGQVIDGLTIRNPFVRKS